MGAAARAMKTMGLSDLVLVNPRQFPNAEATSRAAGAADLLKDVKVVSSLEEAISDRTQVFATTARKKHAYQRPQRSSVDATGWIKDNPNEKVAIIFGRERMGMSSADIDLCQQILFIPGNPEYDVLNLAAAVQIVCYELCKQLSDFKYELSESHAANLAPQEELEQFFTHLQTELELSGYLRTKQPSETMKRLRRFFTKAEPTAEEVSMLRGLIGSLAKNKFK
ncbi:MAG: RNA methyltransferase [Kangiellaceae bacterium]|nr:RNA methyltransferase [Kangiellaceae bacterium]